MPCRARSSLLEEYHGVLEDSNIPTMRCSAGVSPQCHGTAHLHDDIWTLASGMRPLRAIMHIKHRKSAALTGERTNKDTVLLSLLFKNYQKQDFFKKIIGKNMLPI